MPIAILYFFASGKGVGEESDEVKKILRHAFSLPFAKMEKVETIKQEVKHLRVLMEDLKNENKQLKVKVKEKDKQLKELNRQDISNIDQHLRGWSAHVMNIPLTEEEERDTNIVMVNVYELILKGTRDIGKFTSIPSAQHLLETAHVLPGNTNPVNTSQ